MKGEVKFYNENKRFGFIVGEDEEEYFVHVSGLVSGVSIKSHDLVTFDIEGGGRGKKAINVRKE